MEGSKLYTLADLISNIGQFKNEKCPADFPISAWIEGTWIKWNDEERSFQMMMTGDTPVWAFGFSRPHEILSPYYLIGIFKRLFPSLSFKYNEETMRALVRAREQCFFNIDENLNTLVDDDSYRKFPEEIRVSDDYMLKAYIEEQFL